VRLLLDTHALIWFLDNDPRLSPWAKSAISDPANERWLCPISLLEIAIKVRIRKLRLADQFANLFPAELLRNDIHLLPLEPQHVEPLTTMSMHHKDPFDRLIAATTLVEQLTLVSVDAIFDSYGLSRLW
jgi:PIN domain nuclease of toxin-antitoxin system